MLPPHAIPMRHSSHPMPPPPPGLAPRDLLPPIEIPQSVRKRLPAAFKHVQSLYLDHQELLYYAQGARNRLLNTPFYRTSKRNFLKAVIFAAEHVPPMPKGFMSPHGPMQAVPFSPTTMSSIPPFPVMPHLPSMHHPNMGPLMSPYHMAAPPQYAPQHPTYDMGWVKGRQASDAEADRRKTMADNMFVH